MPILVYLLLRVIPHCTLRSLHKLDEAYQGRLKPLVNQELRERTRAVLSYHIVAKDRSWFLRWFRMYAARVVGDSAAWVCAGLRNWDPSSLDVIVPYSAYNEAFEMMKRHWPAVPKGPVKSLLPSREGPETQTFIFSKHQIVSLRRAADRDAGVFHAVLGQTLTVHCAFFDLGECASVYPDLQDRQVLLPTTVMRNPGLTAHAIADWLKRGWSFYSSTGVQQWTGPCGTGCPELNRAIDTHASEVPLLRIRFNNRLDCAPSVLDDDVRWRLGGACYNKRCPRCMMRLSILRDRFLRTVGAELQRLGHTSLN